MKKKYVSQTDEWMDGQVDRHEYIQKDGRTRPNHMRSNLDALQTRISVDFRRVTNKFDSIAKQALFETMFFRVPGRFWTDFWKFSEGRVNPKSIFGNLFGSFFSRPFLISILDRCLEAKHF